MILQHNNKYKLTSRVENMDRASETQEKISCPAEVFGKHFSVEFMD